jgi:hypothetical protein
MKQKHCPYSGRVPSNDAESHHLNVAIVRRLWESHQLVSDCHSSQTHVMTVMTIPSSVERSVEEVEIRPLRLSNFSSPVWQLDSKLLQGEQHWHLYGMA